MKALFTKKEDTKDDKDDPSGASNDIPDDKSGDEEGFFKSKVSVVKDKVDTVKDKVGDKLDAGFDKLPAPVQEKIRKFQAEAEEMKRKMDEMIDKQSEMIRAKVAEKINQVLDRGLDKAGKVLAEKIKDDAMPVFVQDAVDGTIGELMPDVKREIMESVEAKLRKTVEHDEGERPRNPYKMLRAFVLHTLFPCDKTIWEKLRNPAWYFLIALMAFPRWGVHQFMFFLILVWKDKSDEFQIVEYIVTFKAFQFFSVGVIPSIVGAFQMYFCMTDGDPDACSKNYPGIDFWELMFFVAQVLFMWVSFVLLPYAEKKGGPRFKHMATKKSVHRDPPSTPGCCGKPKYKGRGGKLAKWVYYDTFIFIASSALIAVAIATDRIEYDDDHEDYWKSRATFLWARVLYGLLSFPWMLFKLPLVFTLFTHARPTGYNRNGVTMPIKRIRKKVKTNKDKNSDDEQEDVALKA